MNNYDLSKVDSEKPQSDNVSPYMTYGSAQVLKINSIELKFSQNTKNPKAILHMETKPINDTSFTPIEGAKGKVGKVGVGVYMNSDELKKEFLQKMKTIAAAVGVEDEINRIKSESFEEVVQKISNVIKNRYAKYTIVASEYPKPDGKVGITLSLPKFKFVENENADPSTIVVFDKENKYHFRKIDQQSNSSYSNSSSAYGNGSYGNSAKPAGYGGTTYSSYSSSSFKTPTSEPIPDNPDDPAVDDLPF